MRAKKVFENIDFKRGMEPRKSLGIGSGEKIPWEDFDIMKADPGYYLLCFLRMGYKNWNKKYRVLEIKDEMNHIGVSWPENTPKKALMNSTHSGYDFKTSFGQGLRGVWIQKLRPDEYYPSEITFKHES